MECFYRYLDKFFGKNLPKLQPQRPGIYIGAYRDPETGKVEWLRDESDRHVLLAAPTRAGKGVSFVVPNLLTYPESMVVYDLKGELWEMTSGYRRTHLNNLVFRFDPTCNDGTGARFNPLAEVRLRTEHEVEDAANISTFIVDPDGKAMMGEHGHWARTARSFLTAAILHVLYCEEDKTLRGLDAFLSDERLTQSEVFEEMLYGEHDPTFTRGWLDENNEPTHTMKEIAMAARDMIERPPGERGSVMSSVKSYLDVYRDPIIAKNTCKSDFSIQDLMNNDRPVTLYIVNKPSDMDRVRPLTRLIFNFVLRTFTHSLKNDEAIGRPNAAYKHPLLLLMDEFPSLGNLPSFTSSLPWLAGYNIRVALIIQDESQLVDRYREAGASEIMANMHIKILYAPGDPKTAKKFSDMIGNMTVRYHAKSIDSRGKISLSEREDARLLLTPDEFMSLGPRQGVIVINQERPIASEHIVYYEEPLFRARLLPACIETDRIEVADQAGQRAIKILRDEAEHEARRRIADAVPVSMEERAGREKRHTMRRAKARERRDRTRSATSAQDTPPDVD